MLLGQLRRSLGKVLSSICLVQRCGHYHVSNSIYWWTGIVAGVADNILTPPIFMDTKVIICYEYLMMADRQVNRISTHYRICAYVARQSFIRS